MADKPIPGKEYPGVICDHCKAPIAMRTPIDQVDPVFQAKCPKCGQTSTYQLAEVQRLLAHRKQ